MIDHGRVASTMEAYQVHVGPMRSASVGWLKLKSADPKDHPIIEPNYMSAERDIWEFRQCVKLTREIFAQKAFEKFRGPEIQPGNNVQSDKEIDAFIRQKTDSAYHPSCTCKMGQPSDGTAVVDPQTKEKWNFTPLEKIGKEKKKKLLTQMSARGTTAEV